ncbi:MAG: hypothetical protein ACI9G1_004266 [Pirellulaceae bacterium]|jgi:hypothetical protein
MDNTKHFDVEYDVTPIGQFNTQTCWIACYRMLYAWNKVKDKTCTDIKCYERLQKTGLNLTSQLLITEWRRPAAALKLFGYRVSSLRNFDTFQYIMSKCGPFWCAGDFIAGGGGHVILVTAAYGEDQRIRIIDPWQVHQGTTSELRDFSYWTKNIKNAPYAVQMWW